MNSPVSRPSISDIKTQKRQSNSNMSISPTKRARHVGNLTISVSATLLKNGEYRGRCKYKSGRCPNERTLKFSGEPHTLCEEHRVKHNKNQRKSDAKRRGVVKVKRDPTPIKTEVAGLTTTSIKKSKTITETPIKAEPIYGSFPLSQEVLSDPFEIEEIDMSETSSCWSEDEVEILKNIFDCDIPLEI